MPLSQVLDGLGEAEILDQPNELDDIPSDLTAEAFENLLTRTHVEGRRLLVVKRAESDLVLAAFLQTHIAAYNILDVVAGTDLMNIRFVKVHLDTESAVQANKSGASFHSKVTDVGLLRQEALHRLAQSAASKTVAEPDLLEAGNECSIQKLIGEMQCLVNHLSDEVELALRVLDDLEPYLRPRFQNTLPFLNWPQLVQAEPHPLSPDLNAGFVSIDFRDSDHSLQL